MKTKIKTKNKTKTKIKFIIFLFFALAQIGRADISLGASIIAQDMINLTNGSRTEAGLAPLAINEKLARAAEEKANDMFRFQYFDHNSPNGTTPWDFIKSAGYEYKYAGENLAIDFISASGAHKALMESSSHRDNILNMNYTEIGIAVKEDIFEGNKSIIIVEEFASPLYIEKTSDYNLNENVELILEEKADEINSLKDKKEKELEEFSQTGSARENGVNDALFTIGSTQESGANSVEENETELFLFSEEKNISETGDVSEVKNNISNSGLENASALYFLKDDMFEKWLLSLFPNKDDFTGKIAAENNKQKINKSIAQDKPILSAENLNKERIMGLASEASFKETYLNKFKYQTNLSLNNYFQNELSARVLLVDLFLAILLIFDFWFMVRVSPRNLAPKAN